MTIFDARARQDIYICCWKTAEIGSVQNSPLSKLTRTKNYGLLGQKKGETQIFVYPVPSLCKGIKVQTLLKETHRESPLAKADGRHPFLLHEDKDTCCRLMPLEMLCLGTGSV